MRGLFPDCLEHLLVLGAHCDDIGIGAGATLLATCRARPGLRVTALVLCGGGTEREAEERAALQAFCPDAKLEVTVLGIRDGRLPAHWTEAKEALELLRTWCDPDLILAPSEHDSHQDHRALAQLVPTAFRDHLKLGYEIVKWDGDLAQPQAYVAADASTIREKWQLLYTHYPSQHARQWFREDTFSGLARIRGVQCQSEYAEAFHIAKLLIDPAGSSEHSGAQR